MAFSKNEESYSTGVNAYCAVILAAGYSSRMQAFKPLLDVGGRTPVARLTDSLRRAGIERIVVVTGHERRRLLPVISSLGLEEAFNENYHKGMFSSIKTGLAFGKALWPEAQGFFLMPVDCPLISGEVIKALMASSGDGEEPEDGIKPRDGRMRKVDGASTKFLVPTYEGKKGHPLLVCPEIIDEICEYEGPGGLKGITDIYMKEMVKVPVDDEACLLDMDTPQGYEEIKEYLEKGGKSETLVQLAEGRKFFLVRHGETRQHREKMFIGRYDVPLSDKGREDAKSAAACIAEELSHMGKNMESRNKPWNKIYSSSLVRAAETAGIIADVLKGEVEPVEEFTEINLGPWDGRPVREIKEEFPELYELRGRDIFGFKTGNDSENFYDMQYRVIKALKRLLQRDESIAIIIVAHSGVIRAIENNLKGLKVHDSWEPMPKGAVRKIFL